MQTGRGESEHRGARERERERHDGQGIRHKGKYELTLQYKHIHTEGARTQGNPDDQKLNRTT